MKALITRRYIVSIMLTATFLLSAVSAIPQERRAPGDQVVLPINRECPKPFHPYSSTLNAATPYVDTTDFTPVQLALPRAWLNDPAPNKAFLFTFQVGILDGCCGLTGAKLTVKMKANQGGQSYTSSDAGNDGISIMHAQNTVPPFSAPVYNPPNFSQGQTAVRTWILQGSALSNLIANHRLSIYVQDDTMVESATLEVWGCCLKKARPGEVPETGR